MADNRENAFESLLGECKNSKACQALLIMGKILYLNNNNTISGSKEAEKVKQEQNNLAEVNHLTKKFIP